MFTKMKDKKETTVEFRSARLKVSAFYPKSIADKMEADLKNDGWYRVEAPVQEEPKSEPNPKPSKPETE